MLKTLEVSQIFYGTNIREDVDSELMELADSIKRSGLLNPITVVKANGRYEVVAGHRRYKALKLLNEEYAECNVLDYYPTRKELLSIQLQENLCRKNMSAWELTDLFKQIQKEGIKRHEIARMCGKTEGWISQQYMAAECLEKYDDVTAETKKMSYHDVKKKYGDRIRKRTWTKTTTEPVRVSRTGCVYTIRLNDENAAKEFAEYIKEFKQRWLNSKTSE